MANWRDMAAAALASPKLSDTVPDWGLDPGLVGWLRRLPDLPAPQKLARPGVWAEVVVDAVRLAETEWAAKALAQGWSPLDVFGVGERSSDEFEGLAVWLAGRKLAWLGEWTAATTCRAIFYRETFGRPNSPRLPALFLWQFGRS